MKFSVSSTNLSSHLQAISRVISNKNTLPILNNFLFDLEGNKLMITASDLETTLITSLDLDSVEGNGKVAVPAKLLLDTLREIAEMPLTFEINDDNLAIVLKTENGHHNFIGQNGNEYPKIQEVEEETCNLELTTEMLLSGITKTIFASADDDLRPIMNGVYFDIKMDSVTLVATDAHKLVRFKALGAKGSADAAFVLAKKPANLLKAILPKETGNVSISFDTKNAVFTLSNYKMVCRQIEGQFPQYDRVIPTGNSRKLIIDRTSLINSLRLVSVYSNEASNLIKLQLFANELVLTAQDLELAVSAEEKLPCQYEGEPMSIGFKSTFLIEILSNIESNDIIVELADPSRAGLILPFENTEGEDLLMLLMPLILND